MLVVFSSRIPIITSNHFWQLKF